MIRDKFGVAELKPTGTQPGRAPQWSRFFAAIRCETASAPWTGVHFCARN